MKFGIESSLFCFFSATLLVELCQVAANDWNQLSTNHRRPCSTFTMESKGRCGTFQSLMCYHALGAPLTGSLLRDFGMLSQSIVDVISNVSVEAETTYLSNAVFIRVWR